jgi:hypothetical protein
MSGAEVDRPPARPTVDVVVPFAGSLAELEQLQDRLAALALRPGDSVVVVDNTPRSAESAAADAEAVPVLPAPAVPTPAFARNRGAERGSAEWLVFLDADTIAGDDLLDRYFDPAPGVRTGLIGGGVLDEPAPAGAPLAVRYAFIRRAMSQDDTFDFGAWGYPKTANVACRRAAFEAVGGFREEIRAAEDADLTYRLRERGWDVERRETASVVHLSRPTVAGLIRQKLLWGAGGAWLRRTYPGSVGPPRGSGLVVWAIRELSSAVLLAFRRRDRDAVIYALLRPIEALAWEFGRLLSNERDPARAGRRRHLLPR